jgi:hypothetical protein
VQSADLIAKWIAKIFSARCKGVSSGLYHISRNFTGTPIFLSHRVEDCPRTSIGLEPSTAQQHARSLLAHWIRDPLPRSHSYKDAFSEFAQAGVESLRSGYNHLKGD